MEMTRAAHRAEAAALEESLARRTRNAGRITEGHLSLAPHNSNPILTNGSGCLSRRATESLPASRSARRIATTADFNASLDNERRDSSSARGVSYLCPRVPWRDIQRHNGKEG